MSRSHQVWTFLNLARCHDGGSNSRLPKRSTERTFSFVFGMRNRFLSMLLSLRKIMKRADTLPLVAGIDGLDLVPITMVLPDGSGIIQRTQLNWVLVSTM